MTIWCAYVYDRCFQAIARNKSEAQIAIRVQIIASGISAENVSIEPFKVG